MINFIDNEFEVLPFILELLEDEKYSNPLINTEQEVIKCILLTMYSEIDFAIGIYNEDILTGVFGFVCDQNSNYLEMIFGYSKSLNAYNEMFNYLKENYKGYNVDFLINPKNDIFYNFLKTKNSKFYPLQLYMILETIVTYNSNHQIEFYSDKYKEEYINIHEKNMYWTGDKIILYPDRFITLLAIYKKTFRLKGF